MLSGQSSDFEAQLVAGLVWLLNGRLSDQLMNERDPYDGQGHTAVRDAV